MKITILKAWKFSSKTSMCQGNVEALINNKGAESEMGVVSYMKY